MSLMKKRVDLFLLFFTVICSSLIAQTDDYGLWTTMGATKDLGKWDFSAEAELRTQSYLKQLDKWSLQAEANYTILKPFKIGVSYQFITYNDIKYNDLQPRHRFALFLTDKTKIGNFTFSLRERLQITTKDESDRIKKSGKINTYLINPEWTWRNRLKIAYDIPNFPINPAFSFESFYQLNNPEGNTYNNLRYTLSLGYKLSKHHELEIYGLIDKDINVSVPITKYVMGIGYVFSF
jgi:hypothetical protein